MLTSGWLAGHETSVAHLETVLHSFEWEQQLSKTTAKSHCNFCVVAIFKKKIKKKKLLRGCHVDLKSATEAAFLHLTQRWIRWMVGHVCCRMVAPPNWAPSLGGTSNICISLSHTRGPSCAGLPGFAYSGGASLVDVAAYNTERTCCPLQSLTIPPLPPSPPPSPSLLLHPPALPSNSVTSQAQE